MATVLVTGAGSGLGLGTARQLAERGHDLVLHARSEERAADLADLRAAGARLVVADLADPAQVRALADRMADRVAEQGGLDAIIHNAGVMEGPVLPVNVVAPYLLTARLPVARQVYLSSGMHRSGRAQVDGLDWSGERGGASYSDSKLLVTALAAAVARLRPDRRSHAVDPGWVATRMGGPSAPDDYDLGCLTQAWLAGGDVEPEPASAYWHHQQTQEPHRSVADEAWQAALVAALAEHTGVTLDGAAS